MARSELRSVLPRAAIFGSVLLTAASAARADGAPPELAGLLQDNANQQRVIDTAKEQNARLPEPCGTASFTPGSRFVVLLRPRFDAAGKPVEGAWQQSVMAEGCGAARQFNVLTLARPDGSLHRIGLLPGTTIADPLLQRDGLRYAILGAADRLSPDCHDVQVTDTRFMAFEGGKQPDARSGRQPGPWREDWIVAGCNQRVVVPMHFISGCHRNHDQHQPEGSASGIAYGA